MKVIVKLLKTGGSPRSDKQIRGDSGVLGMLTGAYLGSRYVLSLHAVTDDSQMKPLLPRLNDAVNISLHNGKMLYRGVAQDALDLPPTAPKHEQEWAVKVIDSTELGTQSP